MRLAVEMAGIEVMKMSKVFWLGQEGIIIVEQKILILHKVRMG